ncbi:MAG: nucleotidyl transferase AbiEii/AbiGii toxin family protein [Desulfuromusa sp.]|nr:nucleotidyl transferase AbiEii/AbiGii toxin family protein [Desulfuromusa sp.]
MPKSKILEAQNFDCLLDNTRAILTELTDTAPFLDNYTLVGGSALSLYLCHRKSEDLDFFTYGDTFERREILEYIQRFNQFEVLNDNSDQLDLLLDGVKVTFFNAKWGFLKPVRLSQLNIASLESIAAMKTNVLFLRAKYRDYYDLYFITKRVMALKKIFSCAQPLVSGLTFKLFSIALLYIDDIEDDNIDHLKPVENLSKKDIRDFFESQLQSIIKY